MLNQHNDLGASLFRTWTDEQKKEEISKLVAGYRSGLPVGILCKMTETIAGDRKLARKFLAGLMTLEERQAAVEKEPAAIKSAIKSILL